VFNSPPFGMSGSLTTPFAGLNSSPREAPKDSTPFRQQFEGIARHDQLYPERQEVSVDAPDDTPPFVVLRDTCG